MKNAYSSFCYDENFTLKLPLLVKLTVFYSIRHLFMVFLAFLPASRLADSFGYLQAQIDPWLVLSDLPALLVVAAWAKRHGSSGPFWRKLWRLGRWLLAASLLLHSGLLLWLQGSVILSDFEGPGFFVALFVAVDLVLLVYILGSPRVRDSFADFPAALPEDRKPARFRL